MHMKGSQCSPLLATKTTKWELMIVQLWNQTNCMPPDFQTPAVTFQGLPIEASFTPDSQFVVSGSTDGLLHLWRTEDGRSAGVLTGEHQVLLKLGWMKGICLILVCLPCTYLWRHSAGSSNKCTIQPTLLHDGQVNQKDDEQIWKQNSDAIRHNYASCDKKCSQMNASHCGNHLKQTDGLSTKCSVIELCSKHVVQPGVTDWSIQRALISYQPNYWCSQSVGGGKVADWQ